MNGILYIVSKHDRRTLREAHLLLEAHHPAVGGVLGPHPCRVQAPRVAHMLRPRDHTSVLDFVAMRVGFCRRRGPPLHVYRTCLVGIKTAAILR